MILFCLTVDTLLKNFKEQNIGLSIMDYDKLGNFYDEFVGCQAYVDDIVVVCNQFEIDEAIQILE